MRSYKYNLSSNLAVTNDTVIAKPVQDVEKKIRSSWVVDLTKCRWIDRDRLVMFKSCFDPDEYFLNISIHLLYFGSTDYVKM